jgi:DNA invertase Pin-like site-specific DNA recombinase
MTVHEVAKMLSMSAAWVRQHSDGQRQARIPSLKMGAKSARLARYRLVEAARRRQFDLGLVVRLDRWGRSVADCVRPQCGGKLTDGRFMISIMPAFSELEQEMVVERVVAGVKKAKAAG